jgi:hypothetical protein
MAALGGYEGEAKRRNAQKIMDASWMRDPATKPVYVKWVNSGLPVINDDDVPVYAKYNVKSYHNITGDEIAYLLQFRLEDMKSNPDIKVGSYVLIKDEMDEPEWWLITHLDDRTQFRQFSILKCMWIYKWVSKVDGRRVIHECLAPPRNQNSYNSGTWLDYTFQIVENQSIAIMPTNDDTRTISYDTKFLISEPGRYPPIAWKISKIFNSFNGDITRFTMTQEQFNPATDNAELMIADYYNHYEGKVEPEMPEIEIAPTVPDLEIGYSGLPVVRAGGGYKKFTLKTYMDGKLVDLPKDLEDSVKWHVNFEGNEDKLKYITDKVEYVIDGDPYTVQGYPFKVKCINDYSLIGSSFIVTATINDSSTSIIVEVTSL